jgi:hypothetical protein
VILKLKVSFRNYTLVIFKLKVSFGKLSERDSVFVLVVCHQVNRLCVAQNFVLISVPSLGWVGLSLYRL